MHHFDPNILVAIIAGSFSLIVACVSVRASSQELKESNKVHNELLTYKIDKLTEKVMKHNNFIERLTVLEKTTEDNFSTVWQRCDELKEDIKDIERKMEK